MPGILGWDIGGVNTKVTRLSSGEGSIRTLCIPFELQRDLYALAPVLQAAARQLDAGPDDHHAVTMTAELSQAFRTKREGVGFVLDAVESAFPADHIHVYTVAGEFVSPAVARAQPLAVAASNWAATGRWVARSIPSCILIDIGTTTTDLIPIVKGRIVAQGRTDPERLVSGELVYSGAVRTPVEAVTASVPVQGRTSGVSAEGFALMGDVHLWLGRLAPEAYTAPPPDGRPVTRDFCGERLARIVCADREMLGDAEIQEIASAVARAQRERIVAALSRLRDRHPEIQQAVVTGVGDFIGVEAAERAGLEVVRLADRIESAAITAPALAVASLLSDSLAVTA
jgi:(4-(4-[2-(gamma-L-glutamylamino)ethyl]phenoxymethyl)furan-2-yl)methanamine synthase